MDLKREELYKQTIEKTIQKTVENLPLFERLEIEYFSGSWIFNMTSRYENIPGETDRSISYCGCISKVIDNHQENALYYVKNRKNLEEVAKTMKKARNILTIDPKTIKDGACYIKKVKGQKFSICREKGRIKIFPVLLLQKKKK